MTTGKTLPANLPDRYEDIGAPPLKGGYGTARVLMDNWLQRKVLLKTIRDPIAQDQLENEFKAIGAIRSKHVVSLFEILRDSTTKIDGLIYEYLPGVSPAPESFIVGTPLKEYLKTLYQ